MLSSEMDVNNPAAKTNWKLQWLYKRSFLYFVDEASAINQVILTKWNCAGLIKFMQKYEKKTKNSFHVSTLAHDTS